MTIVIGGSLNQILFVVLPLHFDPGFRGLFFGNKNMRKKEPEDFDDKMFFFTIAIYLCNLLPVMLVLPLYRSNTKVF
jgi:hypothetical protein